MDTSNVKEQMMSKLNAKLDDIKKRTDELMIRRDAARAQFYEKVKTLPPRPKRSREDLSKLIYKIGEEHERTPFRSKREDDEHIRKIKQLRLELKSFDDHEKIESEINNLKDEQNSIHNELELMKAQQKQLNADIQQLDVQKRLHEITNCDILPDDIRSEEIEIDSQYIGLVIGKNKSSLIGLEKEFNVAIHTKLNTLTVYGRASDLPRAIETIHDICTPQEVDLPLSYDLYRVLSSKKFEHLHRIQAATRTFIEIEDQSVSNDVNIPRNYQLHVRGGVIAIAKVKEMINELEKTSIIYHLSRKLIYKLTENKNKLLINFSQGSRAEMYIDRETLQLNIYGLEPQLELARSSIDNFISENKEVEEKYILEDQKMVGYLLGDKLSRMDRLKQCNAIFKCSKKDEDPPYVMIIGFKDEVEVGKELLKAELNEYKLKNFSIPTNVAMINLLLTNKGQKINDLKKLCNVFISVDKENKLIKISSDIKEDAENAKLEIDKLMQDLSIERIEIEPFLISDFAGPNRSNINKIKEESGAFLSINHENGSPEAYITVSGQKENIIKACEIIQQFLTDNSVAKYELSRPLLDVLNLGDTRQEITKLLDDNKVSVSINDKYSDELSQIVFRGLKDSVELVKNKFVEIANKFIEENEFLFPDQDAIQYSKILSRNNLDELSKSTNTSIRLFIKAGVIVIHGDNKEQIADVKKQIEDSIKNNFIKKIDIPREYIGAFFGKHGNNIKKFEEDYNVDIQDGEYETSFIIYGHSKDCHRAYSGIKDFLDRVIQIQKEITCPKRYLELLSENNYRLTNEIARETEAKITIPPYEEIACNNQLNILIRGNKSSVETASERIQDLINNRQRVRTRLIKLFQDAFIELKIDIIKIQNQTHTRITLENDELIVVGKVSELFRAINIIFVSLQLSFSNNFYFYKFNKKDIEKFQLYEKEIVKFADTLGCGSFVDPTKCVIRIFGEEDIIKDMEGQFLSLLDKLDKENVFVLIEKSFIPIFIGKQGIRISQFCETYKVQAKILNDSVIHITGNEVDVAAAAEKVQELVQIQMKLHQVITSSPELLSSLRSDRLFLNQLSKDTQTKIDIRNNNIFVDGQTEEGVDNAISQLKIKLDNIKKDRKISLKQEVMQPPKVTLKPEETTTQTTPQIRETKEIPGLIIPEQLSKTQKKKLKKRMAQDPVDTQNYLNLLNVGLSQPNKTNNNSANQKIDIDPKNTDTVDDDSHYEGRGYTVRF